MGRYLFQASYSADGIKGVLKDGGTGRRAAVENLEKAKPLGEKDEERRAERGADRRAHSAQQRHREEHHGLTEAELVGADVGEAAREEASAEAAWSPPALRRP